MVVRGANRSTRLDDNVNVETPNGRLGDAYNIRSCTSFPSSFLSSSSSSSSLHPPPPPPPTPALRLDGDKCSGIANCRHCFPFDLGLLVAVPFPRRQQQQQQKEKNPFARGDGTAKAKRPSWKTVVERSDWMTEPRNWNQHASTPKGRASSALIGLEKSKEKPRCVHPERRT